MAGEARSGAAAAVPLVTLGLAVLTVALVVVGFPVMVAPARTAEYFAWTIDPPLTAAFLGTCYWTAALFVLLSRRRRVWAYVRVVMPGIFVADTLIFVATLVHLEKFAMDTPRGWIWVILYACLAPGTLLMLAAQRRARGGDPPVLRPIERRAAIPFALASAALLAIGGLLFAVPATSRGWWLWPLTELTARMVGAWLVAVGVTLVAVLLERDWTRVRAATVYLAAFGAAQLATLARAPDTVDWDDVAAWVYVTFCAALLAMGVWGFGRGAAAPAMEQPTASGG